MKALLEFQDFTIRHYETSKSQEELWSLGPLSGNFYEGAFLLLAGPVASGKSSLLASIVPDLFSELHTAGRLLYEGHTLEELTAQGRRRDITDSIAYLPQQVDLHFVSSDVWQELAFTLENRGLNPSLIRARIAEVAHCLGLQGIIHKEIEELSGGQKQLVALASLLVTHPQLLILDEPASQLDFFARQELFARLYQLNREQGLSIICASHTPEELMPYCSHLLRTDAQVPCIMPVQEKDRTRCSRAQGCEERDETLSLLRAKLLSSSCVDIMPDKDFACAQTSLIDARKLYFGYSQDDPWVIKDCSLALNQGECMAIVGHNASGKSSLLMLLAGALKPLQGKISRNLPSILSDSTKPKASHKNRKLRSVLLPQDPRLLFACESVYDELKEWSDIWNYGSSIIDEALHKTGLEPYRELHPFDLSGGQQQLLALTKLLLTNPDLVLFDEPSSALDKKSQVLLARKIKRLQAAGKACIVATHDLSFAALVADSIALLFDGTLENPASPEAFFAENYFLQPNAQALSEYAAIMEDV